MTKILIDRSTVEQALEALTNCTSEYGHRCNRCDSEVDEGSKAVEALRAALAEPDTCTWQQDGDSDSGAYGTSCRRYFNLEDGTPEDNKMAWCCYCGRKLTQALITEDEDE